MARQMQASFPVGVIYWSSEMLFIWNFLPKGDICYEKQTFLSGAKKAWNLQLITVQYHGDT